jgi:hypothetical protein
VRETRPESFYSARRGLALDLKHQPFPLTSTPLDCTNLRACVIFDPQPVAKRVEALRLIESGPAYANLVHDDLQ